MDGIERVSKERIEELFAEEIFLQRHAPTSSRLSLGLYCASRLTSQVGQAMFFVLLVVLSGGGGALGLGSVMVAMTVAAIGLGPLGGSLADRLGPRWAILAGAALRLVAMAGTVAVLSHGEYAWIGAFVYSAASQVFSPAELSLVATLRRERATEAHASLLALQFGGQAVGALALAPLLLWLGGTAALLGGALVVYLIVMVIASALGLRMPARAQSRPTARASGAWLRSTTLRFFVDEPRALYAVGLLAFVDLSTRSLMIAAPIYLQSELDLDRRQLVVLAVVAACGAVAGLGWAARWVPPQRAPMVMRLVLASILASTFALTALGDGLATLTVGGAAFEFGGVAQPVLIGMLAAVPAVFVLGVAVSAVPAIARSVLTATAPTGHQGRVFAAEAVLSNALVVPALILAALATDLVSARATLIFVGLFGGVLFALLERRAQGHPTAGSRAIPPFAAEAVAI